MRLILDTDIGSDVDDAYALAFALRHPDIELRAVTTVNGDTRLRGRIAAKLVALAGRHDVEVAAGLAGPPPPAGRRAWRGHEGQGLGLGGGPEAGGLGLGGLGLSDRDAVSVLVEDSPGCDLATVGMQTNLAAALDRDPSLAGRVGRLAVMGGVFGRPPPDSPPFGPEHDHNLNVDPAAAVAALNAGIPTLYTPGDVTVRTYLTAADVERLRAGDPLCRALAALTDRWAPLLAGRPGWPKERVAALHDPLTVAVMVDRRFVSVERLPVTVAMHEGLVRTFVDPAAGHEAEVVTDVDAAGFAAFWLDTVLAA